MLYSQSRDGLRHEAPQRLRPRLALRGRAAQEPPAFIDFNYIDKSILMSIIYYIYAYEEYVENVEQV